MQLFLLHFAGGSCYSYEFLRKEIPKSIQFLPLELPGRGKRYGESFIKSRSEAVQDYITQIKQKRTNAPYIIYGHSMGAYLSYYITKEMERLGDPPLQLIVTGNPGPNVTMYDEEGNIVERPVRYLMNAEDFKDALRELGGVNEEIFTNAELYDFFTPILRADFEVVEKDEADTQTIPDRLNVPIHALMGSDEEYVDYIENWKKYTFSKFESEIVKGNHFFINDYPEKLVQIIRSAAIYH